MANPSLAMIPSGYKAGKLYSVLPQDGTGDFTVVRNSVATRVNENGVIEEIAANVPRLDYSDGGCPVLLCENQSTNLVFPSDLGTPTEVNGETNLVAPDNSNSAYYPLPTATSRRFQEIISGGIYPSGQKLTYSWYRKRLSTPLENPNFIGDLSMTGDINATRDGAIQIESDVNGYDRFKITYTITDGSLETTLRHYYGSVIGINNQSVVYWGHQLELGEYATSYIKTEGTTVTRVADVVTDAGDVNTFNSEEGVLFVEMAALADDLKEKYITISDKTTNSVVRVGYFPVSNYILYQVYTPNLSANLATTDYDITQSNKIAVVYKLNRFELWVNGIKKAEDINGITFDANTLTTLSFTNQNQSSQPLVAKVKQLKVFKTALTDEELITLTTI